MSDWRDVMEARAEADVLARQAAGWLTAPGCTLDALVVAIFALRLEVRALAVVIDFARGDAR